MEIVMFLFAMLLGAIVIKVGMDNSKSTQYSKEILDELKEIKELMKKNGREDDPFWPGQRD